MRPLRRDRWLPVALAGALLLLPAAPLPAHPVPRDNHDRTVVVYLGPDAVLIDYRLEVDEFRALRDLEEAEVDLTALRSRQAVHAAYLRMMAPTLRAGLGVWLDGREVDLTLLSQRQQLLDHVRCDYRFRADWRLTPGQVHRLRFYEGSFAADAGSAIRLSVLTSPQLTTDELRVPAADATGEAARRTVTATVRSVPSIETGVLRPGLPPESDPPRPGARGRQRLLAGVSKPVPTGPVGSARDLPPEDASPGDHGLLDLLLDTRQGLGVLLLLAAAFGAVHALTPGHGKTMVAAYLVGQRGTVGHALLLGVVTTVTHTAAVLLVAAVLPLLFPDAVPATVQAALGLVGGLLIAGLGLWLLLQRLAGRADHLHLPGGHSHSAAGATVPPTWWGLVVLGISGGIVPCWDAIAMLGLAISTQRLWLGLPLLLAFSAGLAAVLILIGISVVRAREIAGARLADSAAAGRMVRTLPILSAVVLTVLGVWLCFSSARLAG